MGFGYYGVWYYVSWLGCWMVVDLIGLGDGVNWYVYVCGNFILWIDLSGISGE